MQILIFFAALTTSLHGRWVVKTTPSRAVLSAWGTWLRGRWRSWSLAMCVPWLGCWGSQCWVMAAVIAPRLQLRGKGNMKFIPASVLPGSLQIWVIRGNIEAVQQEGVSQGQVQCVPGQSWSQVRCVQSLMEPCKSRSSQRLVCLMDPSSSSKKKYEMSGQSSPVLGLSWPHPGCSPGLESRASCHAHTF